MYLIKYDQVDKMLEKCSRTQCVRCKAHIPTGGASVCGPFLSDTQWACSLSRYGVSSLPLWRQRILKNRTDAYIIHTGKRRRQTGVFIRKSTSVLINRLLEWQAFVYNTCSNKFNSGNKTNVVGSYSVRTYRYVKYVNKTYKIILGQNDEDTVH